MAVLRSALGRIVSSPLNYWLGVVVDAGLASALVVHGFRSHPVWWGDAGPVLVGFGVYGLVEYVVHRWIYHDEVSPVAAGHRWHHDEPEAPIAGPFFGPALVAIGLWTLGRHGVGDEAASWFVAALLTGLVYYELLHHALHHGRFPVRAFRARRAHHRIHHRVPTCNFGVTTTVWDWLFGTHYRCRNARTMRGHDGRAVIGS